MVNGEGWGFGKAANRRLGRMLVEDCKEGGGNMRAEVRRSLMQLPASKNLVGAAAIWGGVGWQPPPTGTPLQLAWEHIRSTYTSQSLLPIKPEAKSKLGGVGTGWW